MLDKSKNVGEPRPYLRNVNVRWGEFELDDIKQMRITAEERERYRVLEGDVLICEGGEPGRCAVWQSGEEIYLQKALHRVRPSEALSPFFLAMYLRHAATNHLLNPFFTGSTIKHLPGGKLAQVPIPVPPRDEQDRIVASVESTLDELSTGMASLDVVERLLHLLRAAVLENECLGRGAGEVATETEEGLPPLPPTWRWRTVSQLASDEPRAITDGPFGSNLKTEHYATSGPRVIRLQNIGDGEFIDAESHISQSHFERLRAHEAVAGDVVVASLGDALPRACVVPGSLGPAIVKADCARIRVGDLVRADYLSVALNSPPVRRQAVGLIAGIGRQRLSLRKLKELKIPTPPVDEQDRLLERLQRQMKGVTSVRTAIKDGVATVEDFRRSLFLRAFTGQLRTDEGSEPRRVVVR